MRIFLILALFCVMFVCGYTIATRNNILDGNTFNISNNSSTNKNSFPVSISQMIGKRSYDGHPVSNSNKFNQIMQDKIFPVSTVINGSQIANISFAPDGSLNSFFPTDNNINPFYEDGDNENSASTTKGGDGDTNIDKKTYFKVFSGLDIGISEDVNSFICPKDYPYVKDYQLQRDDTNRIFSNAIYRNACFFNENQNFDLLYSSAQVPSKDILIRAISLSAFVPRGTPNSCNKDMLNINSSLDKNFIQVKKTFDSNHNIIGVAQEKATLNNSICEGVCKRAFDVICDASIEKYECSNKIADSLYKHTRYYARNLEQYFCACDYQVIYGTDVSYYKVAVDIENIAKYKNLISSVTCGN